MVRLAIFQSAAFALLPETLSYLAEHAPSLTLQVLQIDPETGTSLTRSREYDMVLSEAYPHHHIPEYPELHSELLTEDPLSLIVPSTSTITSTRGGARAALGPRNGAEHLPQLGTQPVPHRRIRAGHPL